MTVPGNILLGVILNNVSSYVRSKLCMCSRWLEHNAIEVSITKILQREAIDNVANNIARHTLICILEDNFGVINMPPPADFHNQLRAAFINIRDLARVPEMTRYSYTDYHMCARYSPPVSIAALIHGDDDVCEVIAHKINKAEAILVLAARGYRGMALAAYNRLNNTLIHNPDQLLQFGTLLAVNGNQAVGGMIAKEPPAFIKIKAACYHGDDNTVAEILAEVNSGAYGDIIWGVDELRYAAAGGNAATVARFLYGYHQDNARINRAIIDAISLYTRRVSRGIPSQGHIDVIVMLIRSLTVPITGNIFSGFYRHIDVVVVRALVDHGCVMAASDILGATVQSPADVVKYMCANAPSDIWADFNACARTPTNAASIQVKLAMDHITKTWTRSSEIFVQYLVTADVDDAILFIGIEYAAKNRNTAAVIAFSNCLAARASTK